jgi:hypothetical protein
VQLPHDSWPEALYRPGTHAVQFHERPPLHVPASHFVTWVAAAFLLVLSPGPLGKQPPESATGAYLPCSQSTHAESVRLAYCPAWQASHVKRF